MNRESEDTVTTFRDDMHSAQLRWRERTLPDIQGQGWWQKKQYDHILPRKHQQENLWPGIRTGGLFPLDAYLTVKKIQAHTGRDNLLSSWTLAANLYFPFGQSEDGRRLVADFLAATFDAPIASVKAVELEWEHANNNLRPPVLLGETDGSRGTNQTSPDVAFEVTLAGGGHGVVLTEVKFTEHNFYACSIRKQLDGTRKAGSCHDLAALRVDPRGLCGQHTEKDRRYWDHLNGPFDWGASVRWCPAATAGYQLFRQQALAEALAVNPDLGLVVSSLAYDDRNVGLLGSLRGTGTAGSLRDVRSDWGTLFRGKAHFKTFSHQSWVAFVRQAAGRPTWCDDWAKYVTERYGL
jgi:hypothetical protein